MDSNLNAFSSLNPEHALARLRISPAVPSKAQKYQSFKETPKLDTSTLAAHDFDVDPRSGFMPPEPPIARLPTEWDEWEQVLDAALQSRLKIAENPDISPEETERSRLWRETVSNMKILDMGRLRNSERLLRRAHLVLTAILHIYVQTQPSSPTPIVIPAAITVPVLAVSRELVLPPVLTYSDTVLYNWAYANKDSNELKSLLLLSGTKDEEHFYLTSAYIELAGVEALSLMRRCFDEAFVADSIALKRITSYLKKLSSVIKRLTKILDAVRDGCDPKVFYNDIRPWFKGEDSGKRKWLFQDENGNEVDFGSQRELSGPSAGQSSLIHALDVFLGVDHTPQRPPGTSAHQQAGTHSHSSSGSKPEAFLDRMQRYMPRHHRAFLVHLKAAPRPIRNLVSLNATNGRDGSASSLANAYDAAVLALKGLRDAHIRIATLYIINQMPRPVQAAEPAARSVAKGTGGSDLVPFLKGSRDDTTRTLLNPIVPAK